MGHVFSGSGVAISKDRIEAIQNLPDPVDKKELQKVLGVLNYICETIHFEESVRHWKAISYACKKLHNYIYVRSEVVKRDHESIVAILEINS